MKIVNNNFKKSLTSLATAGVIGLAAIAAGSAVGNHADVAAATAPTVKVSVSAATIYNAPGNGSATGKVLAKGTTWKTFGTVKDSTGHTWFNLGGNQWVGSGSVSIPAVAATSSTKAQAVINLAKQQIGKPYVWGGKGPNGFDCSGLMHYVFANALGKEIGGWTVPQESAGTQVSINNLKAGDLVFWGSRGATYHVGLYLGNGQYLHAPQPGQTVTIATISSYFMPSFGVRVL